MEDFFAGSMAPKIGLQVFVVGAVRKVKVECFENLEGKWRMKEEERRWWWWLQAVCMVVAGVGRFWSETELAI